MPKRPYSEKEAAYKKQYYADNKVEILAKANNYNNKNKDKTAARYVANREQRLEYRWKRKYNGTDEQYQHYLNVTHCECCRVEFTKSGVTKKVQDHCHITGEIRNVICSGCNTLEGFARDLDQLKAVAKYKFGEEL